MIIIWIVGFVVLSIAGIQTARDRYKNGQIAIPVLFLGVTIVPGLYLATTFTGPWTSALVLGVGWFGLLVIIDLIEAQVRGIPSDLLTPRR